MSAFIHGNEHINYIVNAMELYGNSSIIKPGDFKEAQRIGQLLVDENYRSVNFRYTEKDKPYKFKHTYLFSLGIKLDPVQVIKACESLHYQSCENENHDATEAAKLVRWLIGFAHSNLPGYDKAQWAIDYSELKTRKVAVQ